MKAQWILCIVVLVVLLMIGFTLLSCSERTMLESEKRALEQSIETLKHEKWRQEELLREIALYPDGVYLVTFEVRQSTFTIDLFEHAKNAINSVKFTVPVDKTFYGECVIGQQLNNSFKWGSFLYSGDLSKLKVTVVAKEYKEVIREDVQGLDP